MPGISSTEKTLGVLVIPTDITCTTRNIGFTTDEESCVVTFEASLSIVEVRYLDFDGAALMVTANQNDHSSSQALDPTRRAFTIKFDQCTKVTNHEFVGLAAGASASDDLTKYSFANPDHSGLRIKIGTPVSGSGPTPVTFIFE